MNMGKLANPMGPRLRRQTSLEDTEQTEDRHQPIIAPNEMKNHQRSYFKEYEEFEVQTSSQMTQRTSRNQEERKMQRLALIQSELEGIEKMKSQFQKRKKTESQSSIDRIANRSIDRHHLNPSLIPKININTSEFQLNSSQTQPLRQKSRQDSCGIKMEGYNREIIFLDHDSLFELQPHSDNKQNALSIQQQEPKPYRGQCSCQQEFKAFMKEAKLKLGEVELRVEQVQRQNAVYRQQINKYGYKNEDILQKIAKLQSQKKEAKNLHLAELNKKTQYNHFLKELNQQSIRKTQNFTCFEPSQRNKQNLPNESLKKKQNNSKVQALLQRLQLRIQKTL